MPAELLRSAAACQSIDCPRIARTVESRVRKWLMVCVTLGAIAAIAPAVEAGPLPEYDRVRILAAAPQITDVELTDHNGRPFRLSSLQGRAALLLFGFSNCPKICPMGMEQLRLVAESGQIDPEKVAYVMISVDGERDTPAVMKSYVQGFSPQFIGLTGDPAQVKPIAKNFSVAFFKGNTTGDDDEYSVSHSTQIFAVDPAGRLRAEFYNASIQAMTDVTQALLKEAQISSEQENAL
jgi:protein SCO1/2